MAAETEVLRSYLVSLGFKLNESSSQRMFGSLVKADLTVRGLVAALESLAKTAYEMTTGFARSMEEMYYSAQKANATIEILNQVDFAARGVGLGSGEMQGALEAMARTIRANPGVAAMIESFGVPVKGRTMDKVATEYLEVLRKMPFELGSQFAQQVGIGPDQYLLLTNSLEKFKELASVRAQMAKDAGFDADANVEAAKKYDQLLRNISERASLLGKVLSSELLGPMTAVLTKVDMILTKLTQWLTSEAGKEERANAPKMDPNNVNMSNLRAAGYWGGRLLNRAMYGWETTSKSERRASGLVTEEGGAGLGAGMRSNNPLNMMPGGQMGSYATPQAGLEAAAKNILRLQNGGMNTIRKLIGKWAPGSAPGNSPETESNYANFVSKATGIGIDAATDFRNPDTLAMMLASMSKFEQGGKTGALGASDYINAARNVSPVVVQQTTTIAVTSPDPSAAGRSVYDAQGRVNDELGSIVRNQVGALR